MKKISRFLFNTFGETNMIPWLFGLLIFVNVVGIAIIGWVGFHFISKYW